MRVIITCCLDTVVGLWYLSHFKPHKRCSSHIATAYSMISSTSVLLIMIEQEEWGYLNDWEEDQLRKKRTKICMCCAHFRYACTVQCVTLLTCPVHQKLIPQGDHLIKGCKYWVKRRELREGWCPEVA